MKFLNAEILSLNPHKLSYADLDYMLEYLNDGTRYRPADLEIAFIEDQKLQKISPRDRRAMMEKLKDDKFVDTVIPNAKNGDWHNTDYVENKQYWYVTFQGQLHLQDGGYIGTRKKAKRKEFLEKVIARTLWFWVAVSAIYYGLEIYRNWNLYWN